MLQFYLCQKAVKGTAKKNWIMLDFISNHPLTLWPHAPFTSSDNYSPNLTFQVQCNLRNLNVVCSSPFFPSEFELFEISILKH